MSRFWTDDNGVEWVEFGQSAVTMKVSRLKKEPQWAELEGRYNAWKAQEMLPKPGDELADYFGPVEVKAPVKPKAKPPPAPPPAAKPAAKKVVRRTTSTQSRSKSRRR